jgi:hypothetical protein
MPVGEPSADPGGQLSYSTDMDQNQRGRAGQPGGGRARPSRVSAATYWRRRVVVLGVGVGLLTTLSWAANGLLVARSTAGQAAPPSGAGSANSSAAVGSTDRALPPPSPSPSPSPSPRADPVPSPHRSTPPSHASGRAARCAGGGVTLSLTSPQYWYQQGKTPRFTVRAVSGKSQPCRFNMGTRFVAVVVDHGSRRIWSSADCASTGGSAMAVLARGKPAVLHLSWDRLTSSPGCTGTRRPVGPGEYKVTAVAGHLHSATVHVVLGAKGVSGP